MDCCTYSPYVLPTIDFVGGETQELAFHIYFHKNRRPFSLAACDCRFSVVSFNNKMGDPILTKTMEVSYDLEDDCDNILTVKILASETVDLFGKYIYQISMRDLGGDVEIPKQGILYISNNIDKSFIKQ